MGILQRDRSRLRVRRESTYEGRLPRRNDAPRLLPRGFWDPEPVALPRCGTDDRARGLWNVNECLRALERADPGTRSRQRRRYSRHLALPRAAAGGHRLGILTVTNRPLFGSST